MSEYKPAPLPEGMRWAVLKGSARGTHGWFLLDDTRATTYSDHYVIGIFRSPRQGVFINFYRKGVAKEENRITFDDEPLTEELRDRLLPIGLMNRIDI